MVLCNYDSFMCSLFEPIVHEVCYEKRYKTLVSNEQAYGEQLCFRRHNEMER